MPYLSPLPPVKCLRPSVVIAVPLLLLSVLIGTAWGISAWSSRPLPRGEPLDRSIHQLHPSEPFARITGTAHYSVVITQHVPGNLFREAQDWYLFPIFPLGEVNDRAIRVLVRTPREPENLVSFEEMTLEGRVLPLDEQIVPFHVELQFGQLGGYFFSDAIVLLEPWRIEGAGDEPWEEGP